MARTQKGEDWPKFLKEMQRLGPRLPNITPGAGAPNPAPAKPTRQEARRRGFANVADMLAKQTKDREEQQALEAWKEQKMDEWFETELRRFFPRWYIRLAADRPWMFQALGFYITYKHTSYADPGQMKRIPCTVCRVHFKFFAWWELAAGRLLWE